MGEETQEGFKDDPSISDDDMVLRRITPDWVRENCTMSPSAFSDSSSDNAMSVFLRSKLRELGLDEEQRVLGGAPTAGYAEIRVADIRRFGMGVHYDGDPPGHALVVNLPPRRKKSDRDKKNLRDAARWVKKPPGSD